MGSLKGWFWSFDEGVYVDIIPSQSITCSRLPSALALCGQAARSTNTKRSTVLLNGTDSKRYFTHLKHGSCYILVCYFSVRQPFPL